MDSWVAGVLSNFRYRSRHLKIWGGVASSKPTSYVEIGRDIAASLTVCRFSSACRSQLKKKDRNTNTCTSEGFKYELEVTFCS